MPNILTPRVAENFVMQTMLIDFVYQQVQKLKTKKSTGVGRITARLMKDAATEIAWPVTYLVNLTIKTGVIPSPWKEARVTTSFKSGKKDNANYYRPISLLPLISEIMERSIQTQLVTFLTGNIALSTCQTGFRKSHSAETALVYLVDNIPEKMDKGMLTGSMFINLKKAFDLVEHRYLLYKLEHYGIRDDGLKWFRNYLITRTQKVKLGKDLSPSLPVEYGVPQGCLLGPLLFVLYINDQPKSLINCTIDMHADDTVIYCTGHSIVEITNVFQDDMDNVRKWMGKDRLILDRTKTKSMLFGTRQKLEKNDDLLIQMYRENIEHVSKFKYLGVLLDEQLTWKEHTESVSKKVCKRLLLLCRVRKCITLKACKCVYNVIIQPLFDYADTAWEE